MVDMLIEKGWIIVSDMDDDPHAWREFVDSDFRAYRGVACGDGQHSAPGGYGPPMESQRRCLSERHLAASEDRPHDTKAGRPPEDLFWRSKPKR